MKIEQFLGMIMKRGYRTHCGCEWCCAAKRFYVSRDLENWRDIIAIWEEWDK